MVVVDILAAPATVETPAVIQFNPSPTPTISFLTASAVMNANCRAGPGTTFNETGFVPKGSTVEVVGRNEDETWLNVVNPNGDGFCWASIIAFEIPFEMQVLPVTVSAPAPPAPSSGGEGGGGPAPQGCYVPNPFTGQKQCESPCPQNARPGGACTTCIAKGKMPMHRNRLYGIVVLVGMIILGCNLPMAGSSLSPSKAPTQRAITPGPPTQTPDSFPDPVLKVTGAEEVVFDWTTDRCRKENLADLASRAFRGADEQVQFILSHFTSFRMVGPDFDNLKVDCNPIFSSHYGSDPSLFEDNEWLAAPYTEDGQTIYALVHDEYEGHMHPGQCKKDYWDGTCWYGNLTLVVSTDGGKTYLHIAKPPAQRFAGLPYRYEPDAGPYGIFGPSNIIKGKDGYYYNLGQVQYYGNLDQGVCLMRTDDLSDPQAWRYWNGNAFEGRFVDPYIEDIPNPTDFVCLPLDPQNIGASLVESLTFNTYLNRYVLVGISADWFKNEDREIWGYYYSFSDDLIHWTHRKLLLEMTLPWTAKNNTDVMYLYPSLLDPQSDTRNFETTGKTAYLYYTRQNFGQGSLDRDLIRRAVEFFPSEAEAEDAISKPSELTPGAAVVSITKKEFSVSANMPVELMYVWETRNAHQMTNFLANLQMDVSLDGKPLPDAMKYWGEASLSGGSRRSRWLYPLDQLAPGPHSVEVKLSLKKPVSDGLGNTYSDTFLENTTHIEVGD